MAQHEYWVKLVVQADTRELGVVTKWRKTYENGVVMENQYDGYMPLRISEYEVELFTALHALHGEWVSVPRVDPERCYNSVASPDFEEFEVRKVLDKLNKKDIKTLLANLDVIEDVLDSYIWTRVIDYEEYDYSMWDYE